MLPLAQASEATSWGDRAGRPVLHTRGGELNLILSIDIVVNEILEQIADLQDG